MTETKINESQISDLAHIVDFTDLDDTPSDYTGHSGQSVVVTTGEDGLEFTTISGGSGASTFLDLTDVDPSTYSGQSGKSVVVNTGEDGLEFVTVSGGSGGVADFTFWNPDAPPASPSAYDDEFDDASFDTGLWTEFDNDSELTITEPGVGLLMTPTNSSDIMGIWQPSPATYWTMMAKVCPMAGVLATTLKAGLVIYEDAASNPTTCKLITFAFDFSTSGCAAQIELWDDYNTHNSNLLYTVGTFPFSTGCYLRARKYYSIIFDAISFDFSTDGISWTEIYYLQSPSFTPDEIGLFIKSSGPNYAAIFPWFRVVTGEADYVSTIMQGDRVNGYLAT